MIGLVPPAINWTQNNILTNFNNNAAMGYIGNPRLSICKFSVKGFKLEELEAEVENGFIVIKGSHNEKVDEYGLVSRTFTRKVVIPNDIIKDEIKIQLYSNGFLSITGKVSNLGLFLYFKLLEIKILICAIVH